MQKTSLIGCALIVLILSGCSHMQTGDTGISTEVENTLCQIWGESLPTRSRKDTPQTQHEIGQGYADFAAACPDQAHMIP